MGGEHRRQLEIRVPSHATGRCNMHSLHSTLRGKLCCEQGSHEHREKRNRGETARQRNNKRGRVKRPEATAASGLDLMFVLYITAVAACSLLFVICLHRFYLRICLRHFLSPLILDLYLRERDRLTDGLVCFLFSFLFFFCWLGHSPPRPVVFHLIPLSSCMMSKLLFIAMLVLAMLGVAQATGGNFEVSSSDDSDRQRQRERGDDGRVLSLRASMCMPAQRSTPCACSRVLYYCCCCAGVVSPRSAASAAAATVRDPPLSLPPPVPTLLPPPLLLVVAPHFSLIAD